MKPLAMILGFLSAALILGQLTLGQLIVSNKDPHLVKMHQHSGYLTVVVVLIYVVVSLIVIASIPKKAPASLAE